MIHFEFCRDLLRQKTRVFGLSCGIICVILTLSRFDIIPECDRQTDRHTTTAYTALSIASRGNYRMTLKTNFELSSHDQLNYKRFNAPAGIYKRPFHLKSSFHIINLTSPQATSFHLVWVRCDWSQPRRAGWLHGRSVEMKYGQLRWGRLRWGDICDTWTAVVRNHVNRSNSSAEDYIQTPQLYNDPLNSRSVMNDQYTATPSSSASRHC